MWAMQLADGVDLAEHLRENPDAVVKGLEIMTENVLNLVRGCKEVGVDGFYASTQGGESFRFKGTDFFKRYIKPTDFAIWDEIASCTFNILHVCDFVGEYDDLSPFLDYPGDVVNCSLHVGDRQLQPTDAAQVFGRPFMGGLERKGVIATGRKDAIQSSIESVLMNAPERFVLAADCTVPGDTSWDNLKTAIDVAHHWRQ
jgi:uroporphyrinogen decarboxylase